MILSRLIEHVRNQHWSAVFLDFVIVVLGVFIGIQVSNWNEQRNTRAREAIYLGQLSNDVSSMRSVLQQRIEALDGLPEAMTRLLRSLEACSPALMGHDDFERAITGYQNVISIRILDSTYEEMLASGALASLSSDSLRMAISEFYTYLHSFDELTTPQIRGTLPTVDSVVWKRVQLSYDEEGNPILLNYDFHALCGDTEFRNAVVEMIDMQRDWHRVAVRVVNSMTAMEDQLDAATDGAGRRPM